MGRKGAGGRPPSTRAGAKHTRKGQQASGGAADQKAVITKGKRRLSDLYEAEDQDPDELKNTRRYDQVDNYEYEMPSDFEDEEIDEEMAFTEEDKKKYAGWFDDEEDADGDGFGSEDMLGSDIDEKNGEGEIDGSEDAADEEALLAQFGGSDEEDGEEDMEQEDEEAAVADGDEHEDQHRAMLEDVVGAEAAAAATGKRKQRPPTQAAVIDEAYPESEFNVNPGAAGAAGEISLADLVQGLGAEGRRKLAPEARKLLEKMAASGKAVSAPLPRNIKERAERKAGYETTTKEVTKWQPIVQANRQAPTLQFTAARDEVPRINTTAAIVATHRPETDMEAEVAALLEAAGAANAKAVAEAEEKLALKELTLEEARARRDRLAKMRSLLFYHELKAKRLKAIKSKEYHRKQAKAAKRKAQRSGLVDEEQGGEGQDFDEERAALEAAEFERAKERLTLKHKNTSRWVRRALKRGVTLTDAGTKAAVAEQLQIGEALRRKIEGRKGGSDSDDEGGTGSDGSDSGTGSDGEMGESDGKATEAGGAGRRGSRRMRSAALEILAGGAPADGEELPKKGLLALPFMARALERQRVAAQQEAQQVLQELEQEEEEGRGSGDDEGLAAGGDGGRGPGAPTGHRAGRLTFGAGAAAAAQGSEEEDEMSEDDELMGSDDEEDLEAKAERLGRKLAPSEGGEQKQRRQHQKQQQEERVPLPELTPEEQAEVDAMLGIERPQSTTAARSRGQQVTSNGAGSRLIHSHAAGAVAHTAPTQTRSHRKADRLAAANGHHHAPAAQGYATAGQASQQPSSSPRQQQQPPQQEPAQQSTFFPAPKFQGARPGYVFKRGPQGVGYYLDVVPSKAGKAGKGSQGRGKGKGSEGGGGAAAQAGGKQKVSAAPFQEGLTAAAASQQVPGSSGKQDTRRPLGGKESLANGHKGGVDAMDDSSDDDDEDRGRGREGMVADAGAGGKKGSGQPSQLDLIRQAFAGDDVEADFAAEKAAEIDGELPKVEEVGVLPGWGVWADQQQEPRWVREQKEKQAREREAAAKARRDKDLKFVVLSERFDKKAYTKYSTAALPYPFKSQEVYEASIRQPLGRQYNPDQSFKDMVRPAVLKNTGVIINPIKYAKSVEKTAQEVTAAKDKPKVIRVAGGAVVQAKKAKKQ